MDHGLALERLAQVAGRDSRELDRICESVAEALVADGEEPSFLVTSADFVGDPVLICADRYWRLRLLAQPTVLEAAACGSWLDAHVAAEHQRVIAGKWALGYGFITRDSVESAVELAESATVLRATADSGAAARFATWYHAGKLRADLHFDELRRFLETSPLTAQPLREEPLFNALLAFAALGSRSTTAEYAIELLDAAWSSPQNTREVVDVCLNALAVARPFARQGELLCSRAEEAVRQFPTDHLFHARLAAGQRLAERFDEALTSIDTALQRLPATGNRGSHSLLQEQYLQERRTILDGRERAAWTTRQQHLWDQQEAANQEVRHTLDGATVRAVELVAVFTAAIAFAVGSLQVALSGNLGLADRIWLLVALGGGLLLFALTVVGGTWYLTRDRRR
ncbi:hypothetical protein P3T37_006226 [Kitasatospora sp. MAA4]|uniref:hypothetical protein n=1 Tax=Kitasatospora sp. MAA4 TaxID=3035093 RepID=UPI0024735C3C|nr:hypothetical protein [Kitasatospora sp. MAA4]MDH6136795.1 hypothetical protein [Kitasatospora sp. MAA4]